MASPIVWTYDVRHEPEAISAFMARDFVRRHLSAHRMPYLVEDIQLVVTDLVINTIWNAATPVSVTLEAMPFGVTLTVRAQPGVPAPRAAHGLGGETWPVGLRLVELLSADWGVLSTGPGPGESTWATFPIQPVLMTAPSKQVQVPGSRGGARRDTSGRRSGRPGAVLSPRTLAEFVLARLIEDEDVACRGIQDDIGSLPSSGRDRALSGRILADCEVRRQRLDLHSESRGIAGRNGPQCHLCGEPYPCTTLKVLASAWINHPDFDENWAPDARKPV
jgi:hypothetical protein